jgi:hypothetical protein
MNRRYENDYNPGVGSEAGNGRRGSEDSVSPGILITARRSYSTGRRRKRDDSRRPAISLPVVSAGNDNHRHYNHETGDHSDDYRDGRPREDRGVDTQKDTSSGRRGRRERTRRHQTSGDEGVEEYAGVGAVRTGRRHSIHD